MLMLERDGTLVQGEQPAMSHPEAPLRAVIDAYVGGQVDRHLRDVAMLLDDLDRQLAPIRHHAHESLAAQG